MKGRTCSEESMELAPRFLLSPPEQGGDSEGAGASRGAHGHDHHGHTGEGEISPYLTSGTVTELSAMLVDRMICQTKKKGI